jgi:hypothetical protein
MAGTITISTLSDGTNSTSATNPILGSSKAWANFAGATGTINGSFNVSSVTRNSTGNYTVAFTAALPNTNYAVATSCYCGDTNATASLTTGSTYSTTQLQLNANYYGSNVNNKFDPVLASVAVFSS